MMVVIMSGILGWLYHRIARERLVENEQVCPQYLAKALLDNFIHARIIRNEERAKFFLTEKARHQLAEKEFNLLNNFKNHEVLYIEQLEEEKFRFLIKLNQRDNLRHIIEAITIKKILGKYYIHSVMIAG